MTNVGNTKANDVIDSFESSFQDKVEIPTELEMVWLRKAIGRYSERIGELNYDPLVMEFDSRLKQSTIDLLGAYMKLFYQEREVSKVNKRASIVTKDLSWDGTNGAKTAEKSHLEYVLAEILHLENDLKDTVYV